jgi:hypothetical protein
VFRDLGSGFWVQGSELIKKRTAAYDELSRGEYRSSSTFDTCPPLEDSIFEVLKFVVKLTLNPEP